MFSNPDQAMRKSNVELQRMEAQLSHAALLQRKGVTERERHLATLVKGIRKKKSANIQLQHQIAALAANLDAQAPITNRTVSVDASNQRMKDLATMHKLRDISKAQTQEIANLRDELDRLHMATFAAFIDVNASLPPDER
jgi:hypothetical protein